MCQKISPTSGQEDRRDRFVKWALDLMYIKAQEEDWKDVERIYNWAEGKLRRSYKHYTKLQDAYSFLLQDKP